MLDHQLRTTAAENCDPSQTDCPDISLNGQSGPLNGTAILHTDGSDSPTAKMDLDQGRVVSEFSGSKAENMEHEMCLAWTGAIVDRCMKSSTFF